LQTALSGGGKPRKRDVPQAEEAPLSLEQAADGFGYGKVPMAVKRPEQDLGGELFCKQGSGLGLTTASEF